MLDRLENLHRNHKLTPAVLAAALSACTAEPVLLNSERIAHKFGSYGIDILASEAGLRRSSLYSLAERQHICRTYAVVLFTDEPDSCFRPEHTKVLGGNSLGAVFKSNDWRIHKQTLHIGTLQIDAANASIGNLMQLSVERQLALHIYQLLLVKEQQIFEYATIIEAHHPDYLLAADLLNIYHYDESDSLSNTTRSELAALILQHNSKA